MRSATKTMGRGQHINTRAIFCVLFAINTFWTECVTLCVDAAIESAAAAGQQSHHYHHQNHHHHRDQQQQHQQVPTTHAHQFDGAPPRLPVDASAASSTTTHQFSVDHLVHSSSSSSNSRNADSSNEDIHMDVLPSVEQHLVFEPSVLDFHELSMGNAKTEKVTVFNRHPNRSVFVGPISGVLPDFFSTFFDDKVKVIQPLGNTTFNVVFLPRQLGLVISALQVHTSFGMRPYEMRGIGAECLFRLQPLVGIRAPLDATLTPEIYMYNPYDVPLQILEVYSSGGDFKLELPSGGPEAPRNMWEIPPYTERTVVRVSFRATTAGNHTAYIRIMVVDESSDVDDMELVVPIEIEVTDYRGLYADQPFLHFGRGGRRDKPKRLLINLTSSDAHDKQTPSIQSYEVEGDAALVDAITLRLHSSKASVLAAPPALADFDKYGVKMAASGRLDATPATATGSDNHDSDTSRMMSATLNWAKLSVFQIYRGHIAIRTLLSNNQEANLRIALVAEALDGALFYNDSHTQFVTTSTTTTANSAADVTTGSVTATRNFVVRNDFNVPLAINNVSLTASTAKYFRTSDFARLLLAAGQEASVVRLAPLPAASRQPTAGQMLLHTNASTYEIRLSSYNGLLRRIVPVDERTAGGVGVDEQTINYGTLPLSTVTDTVVAFVNDNPVPVTIHNWTATISEAASIFVLLRGCGQLSMDGLKFCYSVQPGEWIVFQVSVLSNAVGTFIGRLTLKTDYEELLTPVRFSTAVGKLQIAATETDGQRCFPGGVCSLNLTAHSTFVQPITVREILVNVTGVTYEYYTANRVLPPVVPNQLTHIARLQFHPRSICGDECYLQLPDRWAPSVISHNCKHQLPDLMNAKLEEFRRIRDAFAALAIRVQTNQVRRYDFNGSATMLWPKLVTMPGSGSKKGVAMDDNVVDGDDDDEAVTQSRGPIEFPTFQVGEEVLHVIEITNPSDRPIAVHLMLHDVVRHGAAMSYPPEVMSQCWDCFLSREQVFTLVDSATMRPSELQVIAPGASVHVKVRFSTQNAGTYSNLLYVRNNFTILEAVWLTAKAAAHQFKFGNRKPGSDTPLVFELTDKHFRDCDRGPMREYTAVTTELANADDDDDETAGTKAAMDEDHVRVMARRTFTAKNTGDIPIDIFGMYIEGLRCSGFGFKVKNCWNFRLPPDTTKKIDIMFSPDFTLARVSRVLSIETSLNYPINYTLLSLVPAQALNTCGKTIRRPFWEYRMHMIVFMVLGIMLLLVVCMSFFDADRLLKEHVYNVSRDRGPIEPPLNLRDVGLRNTVYEDSVAVTGRHQQQPQQQQSAIMSNGHGKAKPISSILRKRNSSKRPDADQHQSQLLNHYAQSPPMPPKSWSEVLARKFSPIKTDVKFREASPPPSSQRTPDNNKKDVGKRSVVAMMDANLLSTLQQTNRPLPEEDGSSTSTGCSTPSSNDGGQHSNNRKGVHQAQTSSVSSLSLHSNRKHASLSCDIVNPSTTPIAAVTPVVHVTTTAAADSTTATSASHNPSSSASKQSKSKTAVKKTKSLPLQSVVAKETPSHVVVANLNASAAASTSNHAKVGKHHTSTEPAPKQNHVKFDARAVANVHFSSNGGEAATEKRKIDNQFNHIASTAAASAANSTSTANPSMTAAEATSAQIHKEPKDKRSSLPSISNATYPSSLSASTGVTTSSIDADKPPAAPAKKYGKTPGRERRKEAAAQPVTRKQNLSNMTGVDQKSGGSMYKGTAFQFTSPLTSAPTLNFAPPPPTATSSSNVNTSASSTSLWDMNKTSFSNIVAQNQFTAPTTYTSFDVTVPTNSSGGGGAITKTHKTMKIDENNSEAAKPKEEESTSSLDMSNCSFISTSTSLFSDPAPNNLISQRSEKVQCGSSVSASLTASVSSSLPSETSTALPANDSANTDGVSISHSISEVTQIATTLPECQPLPAEEPFLVDDLLVGVDLGPIGTRKSPAQTPVVWESMMQQSIHKPLVLAGTSGNDTATNPTITNHSGSSNNSSLTNGNGNVHNPNSFFSSNFPQYTAFDSGASCGQNHPLVPSPPPAQGPQSSGLDLSGLSGLFASARSVGFGSNMAGNKQHVWESPIVMGLMNQSGAEMGGLGHHHQQQMQHQQNLDEHQQNTLLTNLASMNNLLSAANQYGQSGSLNNFGSHSLHHQHHQNPFQSMQQSQTSNHRQHQMTTQATAGPNTGTQSLFSDSAHMWSPNFNASAAVAASTIAQQTWNSLPQQHQVQHHQQGPIRPPPGLERQPYPNRLFNQQQQQQQQHQQLQQQLQQQQQQQQHHHSGAIVDLDGAHAMLNNNGNAVGNGGGNNMFSTYNTLSSIWSSENSWNAPLRPSTSVASLNSNHSNRSGGPSSPPPPQQPPNDHSRTQ